MRRPWGRRADPVLGGRPGEVAGENSDYWGERSAGLARGGIRRWSNLWAIPKSQEKSRSWRWAAMRLEETHEAPWGAGCECRELGIPLRRPLPLIAPGRGHGEALVSHGRHGKQFSFLNPLAEKPAGDLRSL